jgi:hypothetical protein
MRHFFLPCVTMLLMGCAGENATVDPCSAISDDVLAGIFSTPVKTKELTGPREMGDETVATCDLDFVDGQWLTLTIARLEKPVTKAALATYRGKNSIMSDRFGFPIFYISGDKDMDAFPVPTERIHLRVGKNAGGGYAGSFPTNLAGKLDGVLVAVSKPQ